ncbi:MULTISPECIES: hypothetical protein [Klebsiella]|uniref:hypothetical protein n=1 Tax=Klebsiella TaxID=570 RepID=UPI00116EBA25|nr:hypothetical protein [Klebsiella pasteurii]QUE96832.1 hypothetical protein KCG39_01615 [Klebsiella pasteurii]VUS26938.1 hypothetical protein SB6414_00309 [Klebsiella pasteurii]
MIIINTQNLFDLLTIPMGILAALMLVADRLWINKISPPKKKDDSDKKDGE